MRNTIQTKYIITLKVVDSETQDHCWKIHISVQSDENDI